MNADRVPPDTLAPGGERISTRTLLTWGVRVWLVGTLLFLIAAAFAAAFDRFPGDEVATDALQTINVPVFGGYVDFVNLLGEAGVYIPLTIMLAIALGLFRAGWESLLVLISAGARVANSALKEFVERPRPSEELVEVSDTVHGFGFPSGHTVGTAALFAVLFFILPAVVEWRPLRWVLQTACVIAILSAGPARVFVGVHWPSDVFAGYILALLLVGPLLVAYVRFRKTG